MYFWLYALFWFWKCYYVKNAINSAGIYPIKLLLSVQPVLNICPQLRALHKYIFDGIFNL